MYATHPLLSCTYLFTICYRCKKSYEKVKSVKSWIVIEFWWNIFAWNPTDITGTVLGDGSWEEGELWNVLTNTYIRTFCWTNSHNLQFHLDMLTRSANDWEMSLVNSYKEYFSSSRKNILIKNMCTFIIKILLRSCYQVREIPGHFSHHTLSNFCKSIICTIAGETIPYPDEKFYTYIPMKFSNFTSISCHHNGLMLRTSFKL